jgi:hypothetical protein
VPKFIENNLGQKVFFLQNHRQSINRREFLNNITNLVKRANLAVQAFYGQFIYNDAKVHRFIGDG